MIVNINEYFRVSVKSNTLSALTALQLAETAYQPCVVVHASTIGLSALTDTLEEDYVNVRESAASLLEYSFSDIHNTDLERDIIDHYKSNYFLSKALGESFYQKSKAARVIARLPLLMPSHREPYPGWFYARPAGVNIAAAMATGMVDVNPFLRPSDRPIISLAPVDYCGNFILACAAIHFTCKYEPERLKCLLPLDNHNLIAETIITKNPVYNFGINEQLQALVSQFSQLAAQYPSSKSIRKATAFSKEPDTGLVLRIKWFFKQTLLSYLIEKGRLLPQHKDL